MAASVIEIAIYAVAVLAAGSGVGWLLRGVTSRRRIAALSDDWQGRVDDVARQRDRLAAENGKLRKRLEEQEAVVHRHEVAVARTRAELESAREREKRMSRDIFTLRGEREDFKAKVITFQNALKSVKQQTTELQTEFVKSRKFYKGELQKSFEMRKDVEAKLEAAKLEHDSFRNLLQSSRSEHESVNRMLASAQSRLDNLDRLESKVIELEAENAQLSHDARLRQQQIEILQRDVDEIDELKVQNKELAHCLKSMENSRKQHEDDARRYKEYADRNEQKSETLRLRLDEVEQNFADIEKQQRRALKEARREATSQQGNGSKPPEQERDNLQEIVGIGKVFEQALHDLGVYTFKQIAAFGPADIARVNRELKECRGRMEQDDWIGQARDLYYRKYGRAETC